jgi:hypothetical protein
MFEIVICGKGNLPVPKATDRDAQPKQKSEQPLRLLWMNPVGDPLGDQGGVTTGSVVDDEKDLDFAFYGFVHDFGRVIDHLRIQHAADHFVKREGSMSQEQTWPLHRVGARITKAAANEFVGQILSFESSKEKFKDLTQNDFIAFREENIFGYDPPAKS